jgi:hypothetical protein
MQELLVPSRCTICPADRCVNRELLRHQPLSQFQHAQCIPGRFPAADTLAAVQQPHDPSCLPTPSPPCCCPTCRMMRPKLHVGWLHAVSAAAFVLLMVLPTPCESAVGETAYFEPDISTTRTTAWPRIPPSPYVGIMGPNCPPPVNRVTVASQYSVFGFPGGRRTDANLLCTRARASSSSSCMLHIAEGGSALHA